MKVRIFKPLENYVAFYEKTSINFDLNKFILFNNIVEGE